MDAVEQFGRKYRLVVFARGGGEGLDLSELRFKFAVKRVSTMTPNVADIRVYNVDPSTVARIGPGVGKEFVNVILEAGYEGNYGVIFQGNIKQVIQGRESATDTFIDLIAGDGDQAYNFAVVNTTLAAGSTQLDQVGAAIAKMSEMNVTAGHLGDMPPEKLPRGKVMFGNSRDYLRNTAQTTDKSWSIQDGKVTFVGNRTYLPGEAVVLTSKTGMIGTPQQTNEGVNVKCLLNPMIKVGGRVKLDNASVQDYKINLSVPNSPANIPPPKAADGMYFVLAIQYDGDTRGVDWYTSMICLSIDVTTNPLNSVPVSYG